MNDLEIKAFSNGISNLPLDNQIELYRVFRDNPNLIYPTYIHYMAKRKAKETGMNWELAVESEIKYLENYIENKVVGAEVM
jgi:hypothetical protein